MLSVLEEATGVPVLNGYGLTETGGIARNTGERFANPEQWGVPAASNWRLQIPYGNILPAGSEGEIVVRGPSVTSGYLDNPEANESAFRNGWFRTGDIGHLDPEGFLFVTGRLKETDQSRWRQNISPRMSKRS